jgi:hypothetical protein
MTHSGHCPKAISFSAEGLLAGITLQTAYTATKLMRSVAAVLVLYSGITCIVDVPGTGISGAAVGATV